MRIVKLERHPEGHWIALVGGTVVNRRHGSWQTTPVAAGDPVCEVLPDVAAALQERVRKLERAEARA